MLVLAAGTVALSIFVRRTGFGPALMGIGADEQRAQTLGGKKARRPGKARS